MTWIGSLVNNTTDTHTMLTGQCQQYAPSACLRTRRVGRRKPYHLHNSFWTVCNTLEPHKDNDTVAKRVKSRRLHDQAEMERIKDQIAHYAHLQTHKDDLEALFATLTNEYNKLQ
jgi:hypothetical protein